MMNERTEATQAAALTSRSFATRAVSFRWADRIGMLPLLILAAVILFEIGNPRFLSGDNIMNIAQQCVFLLVVATGQMLVLIAGGFDLSVGTNIALTSVGSSLVMVWLESTFPGWSWSIVMLGAAAALGIGVLVGAVNGIGVALLNVNPFVMTLATASIFQGITLIVSQGVPVSGLPDAFVYALGSGTIAGIPVEVLLVIPLIALIFFGIGWTRFGRYLYAIGSNPRASRILGISVSRSLLITYILCAMLAAIAGFFLTARVSSGEPQLGDEFPLTSIAAAVIGGCSLRGGRGTVAGTLLGGLFVTILDNGMDLLRLGSNYQMIALGLVLIGAVLMDRRKIREG